MLSSIELIYKNPPFASGGNPFPDKNGMISSNINGRVRYASSYPFIEENGVKICSKEQYSYAYSTDGHILHKTTCDKHGKLLDLTTYEYDEKGIVTDILTIDSKGTLVTHYIFKYNECGLLYTYEWITEGNRSRGKHVYIYDVKQNVIEERWDSISPEHRWKCVFIYDENGKEIEIRKYEGAFHLFSTKHLKTYDKFGNVIKHVLVDEKGNAKDLGVSKFDEQGRCIEFRIFDYGHPHYIKYDASNKVVEIIPNKEQIIKIIYNEPDSITLLWFNRETLQISKKRNIQFDKHHNITSIVNYEGENLNTISGTLFTYEYYPD